MTELKTSWKPVNWIFFDLDDTIWNFKVNSTKSLHKLYEISPILRKLFKDIEEFIEIYHIHNYNLWQLYSQGKVTTKELKTERWRRTLATRQFEVLTSVCEELDTNYLSILADQEETIPGVKEMMDRLTKKHLIGVLSNGFARTQYRKLQSSGLDKYVTRVIVSEELGINKPDHRIFDYAISETGAPKPYLMVGDQPETDVFGAMKAGWSAIWYNPDGQEFPVSEEKMKAEGVNPSKLIAIVKNMEEMEKAIEKFFG